MNKKNNFQFILCRIKDKLLVSLLCTQNCTNKNEKGISLHIVIIFLVECETIVLVYHFKIYLLEESLNLFDCS